MKELFEEALLLEVTNVYGDEDPALLNQARSTNNHWEMGATEVAKFQKFAGSDWKKLAVIHDRGDHTYPFFVLIRKEYDKQHYIDQLWNILGRVLGYSGDIRNLKMRGHKV